MVRYLPRVSISIINHGHTPLVQRLLESIATHEKNIALEILVTENVASASPLEPSTEPFDIQLIKNPAPKGFASNHNQAFRRARGEYFCLLNPDVFFIDRIFPQLLANIEAGLGDIIAPLVIDTEGQVQDSFRPLPNPLDSLLRYARKRTTLPVLPPEKIIYPDWIAAIFLLMKAKTYRQLGGLDERYWMYFEDVDFSCRARLAGLRPMIDTRSSIVHDAQRLSRRRLPYFRRHIASAVRFFTSRIYFRARSLSGSEK